MTHSTSHSANTPATATLSLLPPPRIPDHELLHRIGRGAYGEVWIARSATGAFRAVKIVRRASFDHDRPFDREFEGIRRFEPVSRRHDSQVDILHVGRGEDYFYYVMELADDQATGGQINPENYHPRTLKSDLLFRNRLPFEECVSAGIALTTALEHLHQNGLVHRDVKPSNIIFVNGVAKLADIGLVTGLDTTRSYVGTEGFAAPEGPGTPQGDIYSLGKVLYELSTGKDRQEFPELPTNLRELPDREGVAELNTVIARACRHNPEDRYGSARAMRAELELLQSGKSLARLRRAEARFRAARRFGAALVVLVLLTSVAFWLQRAQTKKARELAAQNLRLATQNAAIAKEKIEISEENRERLARLNIGNGVRLLDSGDPAGALLWFAEALPLLTNHPAQESIHRIRIQETLDQLPKIGTILLHESQPQAVSFSPGGETVALGTQEGWVHLWDTKTGKAIWPPVRVGSEENRGIQTLRFSSTGDRLLIDSGFGISPGEATPPKFASVVDARSGKILFHRLLTNVICLGLPRDGEWLLTAGDDQVIRLFSRADGTQIAELHGHTPSDGIFSLSTSSDGHLLASTSDDRTVRLWRLPSGEPLGEPLSRNFAHGPSVLSPDGRWLALADDASTNRDIGCTVQILNTANLREETKVRTYPGRFSGMWFTSESTHLLLYTSANHVLIDPETDEEKVLPVKVPDHLRSFSASADLSRIAFATPVGVSGVWDYKTGALLTGPFRHGRKTYDIALNPEGSDLLTLTDEGAAVFWKVQPPREQLHLQLPNGIANKQPEALPERFSADRRSFMTTLADGSVVLVALDTMTQQRFTRPGYKPLQCRIDSHGDRWAISYAPQNGVGDHPVILIHRDHGRLREIALPHPRGVAHIVFSPSGRDLVTLGEFIRIWRIENGTLEREIPIPQGFTMGQLFPDGETALFVNEGFWLFNFRTGARTRTAIPAQTLVYSSFDRAVQRFATISREGFAQIWSIQHGQPLTPRLQHIAELSWAAMHPDGRRFLTAGRDAEINLWNVDGTLLSEPLLLGSSALDAAVWSPDGKFIVARNAERMARVWDDLTGLPVTPVMQYNSEVQIANITADDRFVALTLPGEFHAKDLRECKLSPDVLRDYAALLAGRRVNAAGVVVAFPAAELPILKARVQERAPELFDQASSE